MRSLRWFRREPVVATLRSGGGTAMTERVFLNDFRRQWQDIAGDVQAAVERVGAGGTYILGQAVQRFERSLAHIVGVRWCVGVGNGHDALEIALRSLGLEPGQRVLTTPLSAFATTQAIIRAGGAPVFTDVDASGLLDLSLCEHALEEDRSLRFLLPVHLWGHAADLDRIESIRDRLDVMVVEDCAQSIGARWRGRQTGTVGQAAAMSFYPTKNLGAFGDAGACLTNDEAMAEKLCFMRNHGQTDVYHHDFVGGNFRLDAIQAAVLRVKLKRLDGWAGERIAIADRYAERLVGLPVVCPAAGEGKVHMYNPYTVRAERRDELCEWLKGKGIGFKVYYPVALHLQPCFGSLGYKEGDMQMSEQACKEVVSLPIYSGMKEAEADEVIEVVRGFYGA